MESVTVRTFFFDADTCDMPRPLFPELAEHEVVFLRLAYQCTKDTLSTLDGFDDRNWKLCLQLRDRSCTPDAFVRKPITLRLWRRPGNVERTVHIDSLQREAHTDAHRCVSVRVLDGDWMGVDTNESIHTPSAVLQLETHESRYGCLQS